MAKRKLTPEQQKHKEIGDKMQREGITICEYCGTQKEGLSFVIGATSKPLENWVMNIGTSKMSCPKPECIAQAEAEKTQLRALNNRNGSGGNF